MNKLTKEDVKHVAKLSKLVLTDDETNKFTEQLSGVVTHVSELNKVDTSNVDLTSSTFGLRNIYDSDAKPEVFGFDQNEALSGVDNSFNGYFSTSATLNKKGDSK